MRGIVRVIRDGQVKRESEFETDFTFTAKDVKLIESKTVLVIEISPASPDASEVNTNGSRR